MVTTIQQAPKNQISVANTLNTHDKTAPHPKSYHANKTEISLNPTISWGPRGHPRHCNATHARSTISKSNHYVVPMEQNCPQWNNTTHHVSSEHHSTHLSATDETSKTIAHYTHANSQPSAKTPTHYPPMKSLHSTTNAKRPKQQQHPQPSHTLHTHKNLIYTAHDKTTATEQEVSLQHQRSELF